MPYANPADKDPARVRENSRRYRQRHKDRVKEAKREKAERQAWLAIDRKIGDNYAALAGLTIISEFELKSPWPITYFVYRGQRFNDNFAVPIECLIPQETPQ